VGDPPDRDPGPVLVLGGSGYVAGECLRLLAGHPVFRDVRPVTTSRGGEPVGHVFPHLEGTDLGTAVFRTLDESMEAVPDGGKISVLVATPHGATASLVDRLATEADRRALDLRIVDLSADFRFGDPSTYRSIYGQAHGAPHRLGSFRCGIPEWSPGPAGRFVAHPGCFTTAAVLAAAPFWKARVVVPEIFVSAVTGSSGSGRQPGPGTHHPERRSDLRAYSPLGHRHEAEMGMLLGLLAGGEVPEVAFVPHSGPFVRGIHATLHLRLAKALDAREALDLAREAYADCPLVTVREEPPRLAEVVGTCRAALGVFVRHRTLVVTSVLDNLAKGAAGGGIQWLNRQHGLPDDTGLRQPGIGWC